MSPDDMSPTDQYYWDKLQFLAPHIQEVKPRNVASLRVAIAQEAAAPDAEQAQAPAPGPVALAAPPTVDSSESETPVTSQRTTPTSTISRSAAQPDSMVLHTLLQDFLTKKGAASHFGSYVESRLRVLGSSLRQEAEKRIIQVLNEVEDRQERTSQPQLQPQQPQQQYQRPHLHQQVQVQEHQWQPQPEHWQQGQGPVPSVWGSQDAQWMSQEYHTKRHYNPSPMASTSSTDAVDQQQPQPGINTSDSQNLSGFLRDFHSSTPSGGRPSLQSLDLNTLILPREAEDENSQE